jgi:organic radical activating enzyme
MKKKINREEHSAMASEALEKIRKTVERYNKQVHNETGILIDDFDFTLRTNLLSLKKMEKGFYGIDAEAILNMHENEIWDYMIKYAVDKERIGKNKIKAAKIKQPPITAETIAAFCKMLNEKTEYEGNTKYCMRICKQFNLRYSDKVRQWYGERNTKEIIQKVLDRICPALPPETKKKIEESQKMYG